MGTKSPGRGKVDVGGYSACSDSGRLMESDHAVALALDDRADIIIPIKLSLLTFLLPFQESEEKAA